MRRSKTTKAMALMLSMVMITSVFVGNTLSRYVTSVSSTDSARVAVWGINGDEVTMELFKSAYEVDGKKIAESNVEGEKIIAPGTGGESKFSIINFENGDIPPEVAYQVKIELDDSRVDDKIKNNSSIQWKLDNGDFGTWDELKVSLLSLSGDPTGIFEYAPGEFANAFKDGVEHKIAWQWVMDNNNNETDTQMGIDVLTDDISAKISVKITAEQSDGSSVGMLNGANQIINMNDLQPAIFRSVAPRSELVEVQVNNETVDPSNYEVEEGSTIIKLAVDYLKTLLKGTYTINIVSQNMTATAKFYVSDGPIVHNGIIPEGGTYYVEVGNAFDYTSVETTIYKSGDKFPEIVNDGDVYVYGDYEYRYNYKPNHQTAWNQSNINGWAVSVLDTSKSEYGEIITTINGKDIVNLSCTFSGSELTVSPKIPETVTDMTLAFYSCYNLTTTPFIPDSVTSLSKTFYNCESLTEVVNLPKNLINMESTFNNCYSLKTVPIIPDTVTNMDCTFFSATSFNEIKNIPKNVQNLTAAFYKTKIKTVPTIPESVVYMNSTFEECSLLTGTIEINSNSKNYYHLFFNTKKPITLTGSSTYLNEIAATANKSNVVVANYNDGTNQLYVSETLSENSWDTISKVTKAGKAADYWEVGEKTTVDVNGNDYEVVIAGIDHDGENTVSFVFTEAVAFNKMNDTMTNVGGWKDSKMRNIILPGILETMENKDYIIEVEKETHKGSISETEYSVDLVVTNDRLFLPSYTEVCGDENASSSSVKFPGGKQYKYFEDVNNRIIGSSTDTTQGVFWWLRTPDGGAFGFDQVGMLGNVGCNAADENGSVVPAFVIG